MRLPRSSVLFAVPLTLAAGCAPLRSHQGYIVDADLVNSVQRGVDNRQSVLATLGKPTFASQFGSGGNWYYVSRDTRNYAFRNPHVRDQLTLEISFDKAGTVNAIRRGDQTLASRIGPYGKTTPTLGRKRGFFQDLFGNIGTVGAGGIGGSGDQGGGGRDTP